ncbi:hypothetical protein [Streptomyces sp. NPDC057702]|uniref:hypothetical protein n=1 Tax=unclassified Streptomyces TaxID=2593676 RepID=UPI00368CA4FF
MVRNVFGNLIALIGATAVVWSPFRAWYDGRHGRDVRVDDLFGGLDGARGIEVGLLRSLFLPMACAAVLALVGLVSRRRPLVALAGLVALGFTVLWMVRQGQAAGSLMVDGDGNGLGPGVAGALGGALLLLIASAVLGGRPTRRGRRAKPLAGDDGVRQGEVARPGAYGAHPTYTGHAGPTGQGGPTGHGGSPSVVSAGGGPARRGPASRRAGGARDGAPPPPTGYASGGYPRDPYEPGAYPRDPYAPPPAAYGPAARAGAHPPYATGSSAGSSAGTGTGPTPRITWPTAPQADRQDKTIEMPPVTADTDAPDSGRHAPDRVFDHHATGPDPASDPREAGLAHGHGGDPTYGTGTGPDTGWQPASAWGVAPGADGPDHADVGVWGAGGADRAPVGGSGAGERGGAPWPGRVPPPESDTERTLPQPVRYDADQPPAGYAGDADDAYGADRERAPDGNRAADHDGGPPVANGWYARDGEPAGDDGPAPDAGPAGDTRGGEADTAYADGGGRIAGAGPGEGEGEGTGEGGGGGRGAGGDGYADGWRRTGDDERA